MSRLKSCQYCGRIHRSDFDCGKKPQRKYRYIRPEHDSFRNTTKWKRKREEIKTRDKYLCQICIRNLYRTERMLNAEKLEVHHCEPLREAYEKRLDNDNLLTVCEYHHKRCDSGEIPKKIVQKIIAEQEQGIPPGVEKWAALASDT